MKKKNNWLADWVVLTFLLVIPLVYQFFLDTSLAASEDLYYLTVKHYLKFLPIIFFQSVLMSFPVWFAFKWTVLYRILLFLVAGVGFSVEFFHQFTFGGRINAGGFYALLNTNVGEAQSFIAVYFSPLFALVCFLIFSFLIILHRILLRVPDFNALKVKASIFGGSIFLLFLTWFTEKLPDRWETATPLTSLIYRYQDYLNEKRILHKWVTSPTEVLPVLLQQEPVTHVVVIGESANKHHFSLYGYDLPTNPHLLARNDIVLFDSARTTHAHTIPALFNAFTFSCFDNHIKNWNDDNLLLKYGSVVEWLKAAGYDVSWISNQAVIGKHETFLGGLGFKSDQCFFLNPSGANILDSAVLTPFKKMLLRNAPKKVIFVHLMGSHSPYEYRYSDNERKTNFIYKRPDLSNFQLSQIQHYDRSVCFGDALLAKMINELEIDHKSATLTYFADHGEEVYDFRNFQGHSDVLSSKYMMDIPMFFWGSSSFLEKNKQITASINKLAKGSFCTDNFIYFMLNLCAIKGKFPPPCQQVNLFRPWVESPVSESQLFAQKQQIWIHRVNSLNRLNELPDNTLGVEMDVVFENNNIAVYHPPAQHLGEYLSDFLDILSKRNLGLWLDTKNLNENNINQFIEKLKFDLEKAGMLNENTALKILVETDCQSCLKKIKEAGFFTVFYLPHFERLNENDFNHQLQQCFNAIDDCDAVSQQFENYGVLKNYFPKKQKMLWNTKFKWERGEDRGKIEELMLLDKTVRIVLLRFDSKSFV